MPRILALAAASERGPAKRRRERRGPDETERAFWGGQFVDRKVNCAGLGVHLELAVPGEDCFNADVADGN